MLFRSTKYAKLYDARSTDEVMSNINVTPFIDVMLVLLVVFMISAPLLVNGVNINLPENGAAPVVDAKNPFALTITNQGKIFYDDRMIPFSQIKSFVKENVLSQNTRIYIRGDKDLSYGMVMKLIAEINKAGYGRVSLVTDNEAKTK